jgi:5-methyltetrahydrofolate--homocysteine methyltransferase
MLSNYAALNNIRGGEKMTQPSLPPFREALLAGRRLVCDGAMGTELQRRGLPPGRCSDVWNLENPAAVADVHQQYAAAGAEILLTNTFGTNRYRLAHYGMGDKVAQVARAGVAILRNAVPTGAWLFGEMGPLGEFLEPVGDVSREDAVAAFSEPAQVFADEGVDAIIIETIAALDEMECAIEAVRSVTTLPLVACFTFEKSPVGLRTMTGATPEACATLLRELAVDAAGCNCGTDLDAEAYCQLVATFARVAGVPVIVEPNAGTPDLIDGRIVYRASPEDMAQWVPALVDAGARIIGGCCGTTPDHIRAMARALHHDA